MLPAQSTAPEGHTLTLKGVLPYSRRENFEVELFPENDSAQGFIGSAHSWKTSAPRFDVEDASALG